MSTLLRQHLILILLLGFSSRSFAQDMNLHQALDLAGQNSPEVQKAQSAHEEARWRRIGSYSFFLPKIKATANRLLDKKYVYTDLVFGGAPVSVPGIVPTTDYALSAEWGLFDGFADLNRARSAREFERAAARTADWTSFKVTREVTLQFYRALAAKTLQQVAETNLKTLKDHLHDVTLYRHSGLSTNYDVLRVEVQVSEAESELMNATDNVELSRGRLAELLGTEKDLEPIGDMPVLQADLVSKAAAASEGQRADLEALGHQVNGLELEHKAAQRHWVPRLSAFGNYQLYNNLNDDYDDWSKFRNAYELGLSLTWNLFDGFQSTAQARASYEKQVQSEKTLKEQQLKAKQDLKFWSRKFKYFCSVYQARQSDIGKAKESVRLARAGRKVGARTNTDLLDAEAELYRAQAGAVSAQLGAIEALINVELSLGQPLYNFD